MLHGAWRTFHNKDFKRNRGKVEAIKLMTNSVLRLFDELVKGDEEKF